MNVCPRCKFENLDTGGGECLACGIDIRWAFLNPSIWNEMDLTPNEYKAAVKKRARYSSLTEVCPKCGLEGLDAETGCLACGNSVAFNLVHTAKERERQRNYGQQSSSSNANASNGTIRKKRLFRNGSNITLSQNEEIKITKKTISFGRDVYQFHNVVGFSDGEVDLGKIIPMSIVLTGFFVGFIMASLSFVREYGVIILTLSFVALMVNLAQEKKYGLLLTLTSGDKHLFITADSQGLAKVVGQIRDFMESNQDGSYTVAVNNNSITVHGNLTGVAASGNSATTISSNV